MLERDLLYCDWQATRLLTRIMPNCVTFTPPPAEPALTAWKKMLEADAATLRERENRATLAKTLAKCVFRLAAGLASTLMSSHICGRGLNTVTPCVDTMLYA